MPVPASGRFLWVVAAVLVCGSKPTAAAHVRVSAPANDWAAEDARTIERIDQDGWHGWAMWRQA